MIFFSVLVKLISVCLTKQKLEVIMKFEEFARVALRIVAKNYVASVPWHELQILKFFRNTLDILYKKVSHES